MNTINVKNATSLVSSIVIVAWLSVASLSDGLDVGISGLLSYIPTTVTITTILVVGFIKWGWRLTIFKTWLVQIPDLSGEWEVIIRSNWVDPNTKNRIKPINASAVIYQTLLTVKCVMKTKEMNSTSTSANFVVDEGEAPKLVFAYYSKPKPSSRHRSQPHSGAATLEYANGKLEGEYFTDRRPEATNGELLFTRK